MNDLLNNHVPGHIRDAFRALVDEDMETYEDLFYDEPMPPRELLGSLSTCSDGMPSDLCQQLELRPGANYALGVGAYLVLNGLP